MKIVEVIHCCTSGGAEIYVKNLLINAYNQNKENEYTLIALHEANELFPENEQVKNFEREYISELQLHKINVKIFNRHGNEIKNRIKWYRDIRKYFEKLKPDIIHTHLEAVTFNVCISLLFNKTKIIETIHNEKILYPKMQKVFLNYKIHKVISIADKVTESINKVIKCKSEKIVKIYNGIEIDKFCCKRAFDDEHEIKIVSIGRLVPQKNHKLLLDAFKILIDELSKESKKIPTLSIYGEGDLKEKLTKYISENNIKNVKLMGLTNEVANILKTSDIYVLSSDFEGLSISLIEAMVSGIAIVCTNIGGNNEIIGNEAGILIEKDNITQLVEALHKLLDKNERKKLYYSCQKRKKIFDIKESTKQHLKLYEDILKE